MADTTYQVKVQALWDNTQLKRGSDEAETSIENLAREFDTTTDSIKRDLDTIDSEMSSTFSGSASTFGRSVDDVKTTGGKLSGVGSEIGAEFSENIGEGMRSGDYGGVLLETFTSLGPALGAAGIGLGIGAAVIKNVVDGAAARRKELIDLFNNTFSQLEISARTTGREIRKQLLQAFDVQPVLEALGGDAGLQGGLEKVNDIVGATGISFNTVVDILRGKVNPETERARDAIAEYAEYTRTVTNPMGDIATLANDHADAAKDILDLSRDNEKTQNDVKQGAAQIRDYYRDQADAARERAASDEKSAAATERMANALERGLAAAQELARTKPPADWF